MTARNRLVALICAIVMVLGLFTVHAENETGTPAFRGNGETLIIGIQGNALVEDYENNYFTKLLEDALNVNLDFVVLPNAAKDFRTKVSMVLTTGPDIPDVFIGSFVNNTVYSYGQLGLILPLNQWLEDDETNRNWMSIKQADREMMLREMRAPDGNIYGFASINNKLWNLLKYRTFINKVWLDELGLAIPTTTEELYQTLKAFAEEDPNGNGENDEIPAFGYVQGGVGYDIVAGLINAFTYYEPSKNGGLALDEAGEKVIAPYTTEEFRAGLEYVTQLCRKNLLPADVFTVDKTQYQAVLNAEPNTVGFTITTSMGVWENEYENENLHQMQIIEPLTGPEGVAYTAAIAPTSTIRYIIPTACKNPELAYALGEFMYDWNVGQVSRYGEPGVDFTSDPDVLKDYTCAAIEAGIDVDGFVLLRPGTDYDIQEDKHSKTWASVNPIYQGQTYDVDRILGFDSSNPSYTDKVEIFFYENYPQHMPEHMLPALVFDESVLDQIATMQSEIKTFVSSAVAEFVTGQRSLDDAGWQTYLDELETLGLSQMIELSQEAYDRGN